MKKVINKMWKTAQHPIYCSKCRGKVSDKHDMTIKMNTFTKQYDVVCKGCCREAETLKNNTRRDK